MDVILIAATTADGYIARDSNEVVNWSLDLQLFRKQTMGWPVIMGSQTKKTLAMNLDGRKSIVVHRHNDPEEILGELHTDKCFIIGGGRTYTKFAPYLTHLYLTIHPLVFGGGIPLFPNLDKEMDLVFLKMISVKGIRGLYQFQYKINRSN
ncbi:MAG: dihydrofolate reductase family protein [Candidatus Marinimicrobia bacterium]|mgnify:CR=1 FL=1|nr:dihydrofolate reductase family protein [Candidatus Neomarinimicrobiota bacterium]